jgi:hypothetical protein
VAASLAKNTKIGIQEARTQLMMGRTDLSAGAAALRSAIEGKFGAINARKMLDLDVIGKKFKDTLQALTSGVDLTPIAKSLASIGEFFSQDTTTGQAL